MSFKLPGITPTEEQYALLGRAVADWAIIDNDICTVLARLARTPDFPGLALVEKLGFNYRLDAWRNLLEMHEERYGYRYYGVDVVASGKALIKSLAQSKKHRDQVAHAIWLRLGDSAVFPFKPRGRQAGPGRGGDEKMLTNDNLRALADATTPLIESLEAYLSLLQEVPEVPQPAQ